MIKEVVDGKRGAQSLGRAMCRTIATTTIDTSRFRTPALPSPLPPPSNQPCLKPSSLAPRHSLPDLGADHTSSLPTRPPSPSQHPPPAATTCQHHLVSTNHACNPLLTLTPRTAETMQALCLELATMGDLKLVERPQNYTLAPGDTKLIRANIKVSSTETGVIFGNIVYEGTG